jgi:hypothetical protein
MPERATVFNHLQIGLETVPGTTVASGIQLLDSGITPRPRVPTSQYRPMGSKYPTDLMVQKAMAEFSLEGVISYIDIVYWLSSCLRKATVAGTWNFDSDPFNPDVYQTYTMEYGSSAGAERINYGVVTGLELAFTETECRLRGNGIGRAMADGATLTASPTIAKSVVLNPANTDVYIGDSVGSLANAGRFFEANFNITGRYNPVMTLDSAQPSFSALVEGTPTLTARLVCEKDSVANGYMTDLLNAKTKFMRIKNTDPRIFTGTTHYDFQLTFPFKFREPNPADRQGVWANTYELIPVYDPTFAKAMEFIIVNGLATL